jgi:hypothetical protein
MAWESDRIEFRMYGQRLYEVDSLDSSGIDIWNKRTRGRRGLVEVSQPDGAALRDTGEGHARRNSLMAKVIASVTSVISFASTHA